MNEGTTESKDGVSVFLQFEGRPELSTEIKNWTGPLPRMGEHLQFAGRSNLPWKIRVLQWALVTDDPNSLARGVKIVLEAV